MRPGLATTDAIAHLKELGYNNVFQMNGPVSLTPDRMSIAVLNCKWSGKAFNIDDIVDHIQTRFGKKQCNIGIYTISHEGFRMGVCELVRPDRIGNILNIKVEKKSDPDTFQPKMFITMEYIMESVQDSTAMGQNHDELEILRLVQKIKDDHNRTIT